MCYERHIAGIPTLIAEVVTPHILPYFVEPTLRTLLWHSLAVSKSIAMKSFISV